MFCSLFTPKSPCSDWFFVQCLSWMSLAQRLQQQLLFFPCLKRMLARMEYGGHMLVISPRSEDRNLTTPWRTMKSLYVSSDALIVKSLFSLALDGVSMRMRLISRVPGVYKKPRLSVLKSLSRHYSIGSNQLLLRRTWMHLHLLRKILRRHHLPLI